MTDNAYTGEIRMFGCNFAPRDWAYCDGSLLEISQHTALFSLLGVNYGGDGRTTFALPDFRGRVPIHRGQGPALSNYRMGQKSGAETVQLTTLEMPKHTHAPRCSNQSGNQQLPKNAVPADEGNVAHKLYQDTSDDDMLPTTSAGENQAHNNIQPFSVVGFCICMNGLYPSRS